MYAKRMAFQLISCISVLLTCQIRVYLILHLWVLNREYLLAFREMLMTSIYQYRLDLLHFQAEPIDRVDPDCLVITSR